jgi:hypothetical protein
MAVDDGNFDEVMRAKQLAFSRGTLLGVGEIINEISARADELVPFGIGGLKTSQMRDVKVKGTVVTGMVGYGGQASAYALVQHEDMTLSHPPKSQGGTPTAPGTKHSPKYLEYPTKQVGKRAEKIIARGIRAAGG